MAKSEFTGRSNSYIFEDAGGMRDQLEQTILNELQAKRYPLKATISTLKSGKGLAGAIFGSKEQCVVITIDDEAQIAISNTTVGTYLYVEVYLMVQQKLISFAALSAAAPSLSEPPPESVRPDWKSHSVWTKSLN